LKILRGNGCNLQIGQRHGFGTQYYSCVSSEHEQNKTKTMHNFIDENGIPLGLLLFLVSWKLEK